MIIFGKTIQVGKKNVSKFQPPPPPLAGAAVVRYISLPKQTPWRRVCYLVLNYGRVKSSKVTEYFWQILVSLGKSNYQLISYINV